jgi:hypothetical protein
MIVFEKAAPVLGTRIVVNGFARYVKHWIVSGYTWNGSCMCSKVEFTDVEVPLTTLEISLKELENILK